MNMFVYEEHLNAEKPRYASIRKTVFSCEKVLMKT